jgi:hypothetical protein
MKMRIPALSVLLLMSIGALVGCAGTPYGDQYSITGGVRHERLTDDEYSIKVSLNGLSATGLLKPMALRRARQIGKSMGFESVEIRDVTISYSGTCSCYSALTRVSFSRSPTLGDDGRRYSVGDPDPYRVEMQPSEAKSFARLTSSSLWLGDYRATLRVTPMFVDAVHASRDQWGSEQTILLTPRRQHVLAQAGIALYDSHLAAIDATLMPGESYMLAGDYKDGWLTVWIQHEPSKAVVGRAAPIRISPPLRQRGS